MIGNSIYNIANCSYIYAIEEDNWIGYIHA